MINAINWLKEFIMKKMVEPANNQLLVVQHNTCENYAFYKAWFLWNCCPEVYWYFKRCCHLQLTLWAIPEYSKEGDVAKHAVRDEGADAQVTLRIDWLPFHPALLKFGCTCSQWMFHPWSSPLQFLSAFMKCGLKDKVKAYSTAAGWCFLCTSLRRSSLWRPSTITRCVGRLLLSSELHFEINGSATASRGSFYVPKLQTNS